MINLGEYIFFRLTLVHNLVVSGNTVYVKHNWLRQAYENALELCGGSMEATRFVCRRIRETTGTDYIQYSDIENALPVNLKKYL